MKAGDLQQFVDEGKNREAQLRNQNKASRFRALLWWHIYVESNFRHCARSFVKCNHPWHCSRSSAGQE